MHIRAFSTNGVMGLSPVSYARQTLGLAMATDEASAKVLKRYAAQRRSLNGSDPEKRAAQ